MASVEVHQLQSKHGRAFMNVDEEYGHIEIWGSCYELPTYILQDGIQFNVITFDNEEYAQEWLENHEKEYFKVTKIIPTSRKNA